MMRMKFGPLGVVTSLLVMCAAGHVYTLYVLGVQMVHIMLADEQISVLEDYAFHQGFPRPLTTEDRLAYVRAYYPSGTKQITGTRLDRIVERYRTLAIKFIEQEESLTHAREPSPTE